MNQQASRNQNHHKDSIYSQQLSNFNISIIGQSRDDTMQVPTQAATSFKNKDDSNSGYRLPNISSVEKLTNLPTIHQSKQMLTPYKESAEQGADEDLANEQYCFLPKVGKFQIGRTNYQSAKRLQNQLERRPSVHRSLNSLHVGDLKSLDEAVPRKNARAANNNILYRDGSSFQLMTSFIDGTISTNGQENSPERPNGITSSMVSLQNRNSELNNVSRMALKKQSPSPAKMPAEQRSNHKSPQPFSDLLRKNNSVLSLAKMAKIQKNREERRAHSKLVRGPSVSFLSEKQAQQVTRQASQLGVKLPANLDLSKFTKSNFPHKPFYRIKQVPQKAYSSERLHPISDKSSHTLKYRAKIEAIAKKLDTIVENQWSPYYQPDFLDKLAKHQKNIEHTRFKHMAKGAAEKLRNQRIYNQARLSGEAPDYSESPRGFSAEDKKVMDALIETEADYNPDFDLKTFLRDKSGAQAAKVDEARKELEERRAALGHLGIPERVPTPESEPVSVEERDKREEFMDFLDTIPHVEVADEEYKRERVECEVCKRNPDPAMKLMALDLKRDPGEYRFILKNKQALAKFHSNKDSKRRRNILREMEEVFQEFLIKRESIWGKVLQRAEKNDLDRRPKYMTKYEEGGKLATRKFVAAYIEAAEEEKTVLESMWKPPRQLVEMSKRLRWLVEQKSMDKDSFVKNVLLVEQDHYSQETFFERLKNIDLEKVRTPQYESEHVSSERSSLSSPYTSDEETQAIREKKSEQKRQLEYLRGKQTFNQKEAKNMYMAKNLKTKKDHMSRNDSPTMNTKEKASLMRADYALRATKHRSIPMASYVVEPPGIDSNKFLLIDAQLTKEQAGALFTSQSRFDGIRQLFLVNNSIEAAEMANLFETVSQELIESIVIAGKNELDGAIIQAMKQFPLRELKLIDVTFAHTSAIAAVLDDLPIGLRNFTLSKCAQQVELLPKICKMLEERTIKELDISWMKFSMQQMTKIESSLRVAVDIRDLNISYNLLGGDLKDLGQYIRQNTSLQHLNLNGCLTTPSQVKKIIKKIKKSLSLLAVHISTPVIAANLDLMVYIQKKLGLQEAPANKKRNQRAYDFRKASDLDLKHVPWRDKFETTQAAKSQILDMRYFQSQKLRTPELPEKSTALVLQRTLAHPELPYNRQWIASKDCYICSRHKYTLFLSRTRCCIDGSFDLLSGKREVQLIDVRQFALDSVGLDVDALWNILPQFEQIKWQKEEVLRRMKSNDLSMLDIGGCWYNVIKKIPCKYQYFSEKTDPVSVQKTYKQTKNNSDENRQTQLYVYADYLKPSSRVEYIQYKRDGKVLSNDFIVPSCRKEGVPNFKLDKIHLSAKEVVFNRSASVFKDFKVDTKKSLAKCKQYDFMYWRIPNLGIFKDDKPSLGRIQTILEDNYEKLKHLITQLAASNSSWPYLTTGTVEEFYRSAGLTMDEDPAMVSRNFLATKVVKLAGVPGNMLNRADFFDLLVRAARAKYYDVNAADALGGARSSNPADKMEDLVAGVETITKQMIKSFNFQPWQEFRAKELWNIECDAVFKANLDKLKTIYGHLFPKFQDYGFQSCLDLCCYQSKASASEKEMRFAYGMSKMTVDDEPTKYEKYKKLEFVEFLEFIGRMADAKYKEAGPLNTKIEAILDEIMPPCGLARTRLAAELQDEASSEESVEINDEDLSGNRQSFNRFIHN